jgi:hypothetical protein
MLLAATIGGACAGSGSAGPAAAPPDDARATLEHITAAIGAARCDSDEQCRTVAIGARPCGGPERWMAWSTGDGDGRTIEALAERYAAERQRWHEKTGLMSTCEIRPDPGARCDRGAGLRGRCVLRPAVPGGGGQIR